MDRRSSPEAQVVSVAVPSATHTTIEGSSVAERATPSHLDAALDVAAKVQRDGQQGAVEVDVDDPEELEELRLEVRDHLASRLRVDGEQLTHVRPWIWSGPTSGGRPLTRGRQRTGYELRISRYRAPQYC
jgi:hypothetical protein